MLELEAQLRANPDDAGAWSVYADWLLEHGDARGALVHRPRAATEDELARWRGPIPMRCATRWQHGFVIELDLRLDARSAPLLEAVLAHPAGRLVSAVRLCDRRPALDDFDPTLVEVDACDVLSAVLALDLRPLRAFGIQYLALDDARVDELARARLAVTELDLRYSGLTDDQLARLAAAGWFGGVTKLHLQRTRITDASAGMLARRFEYLDVRHTAITAALDAIVCEGAVQTRPRLERAGAERPVVIEGLSISSQLTPRFTVPRFVEKVALKRSVARDCERVPGLAHLRKVYVDPEEWSFRSFENIVPLDRHVVRSKLALVDHAELAHEVHRFRLEGEVPALDQLPLYTLPLDAGARGGLRYIFHSAKLADALGEAVRAALPTLERFSHVNPVFRCNRFEPGDEPFHRHHDTPYFDGARNQISEYTLLVYLTGGTGSPAIRIEDLEITTLAPLTCLIFHQAYEHAGRAYDEGRKVFLRTELVFDAPDVERDPRVAALFAKACYLTGESRHTPVLARDADRAFNRAAAAHWGRPVEESAVPLIHKQYRGVRWLSNGYDFWFSRELPLADCAAFALLDHFNCMIDGVPMQRLVTREVLRGEDPDRFFADRGADAVVMTLDKAALFPAAEHEGSCCPGHNPRFDPTRSQDVLDLYTRAQRFARARLGPAPIMIMGQRVVLDPERFVIDADKIHVLSADRLAPVNFAACWNCRSSPPNYVVVDHEIEVVQPLVPPILWEATATTHHLMFDFFANSWVASMKQYRIPIPAIALLDPATLDALSTPWLDAASHADPLPGLPPVEPPFWTHRVGPSQIIRELYGDNEPGT